MWSVSGSSTVNSMIGEWGGRQRPSSTSLEKLEDRINRCHGDEITEACSHREQKHQGVPGHGTGRFRDEGSSQKLVPRK